MEPTKRRTPWWIVVAVLVGVVVIGVGAVVADADHVYLTLHPPGSWTFRVAPCHHYDFVGVMNPASGVWVRAGMIGFARMNNPPSRPGRPWWSRARHMGVVDYMTGR